MDAPRLFDLSEYDSAFGRFVYQAINELMIRKNPVLSRIKAVPSSNIPVSRNTMPSGEVVENKPIEMVMPFPVDFNDAVRGDLSTITASIDAAAEAGLGTLMPQFYGYFGRLCEAAGTATHANGEKLSHSLMLKSFENVDIEFDEKGQPEMPTLVTSPAAFDAIRALPPPTQEEKDAWDAMIERKRKEFNDRRRHRQLS
jgi:hypothetical protein